MVQFLHKKVQKGEGVCCILVFLSNKIDSLVRWKRNSVLWEVQAV